MNFQNGVLYCKNGRNYTAIELCNEKDPANTCVMKNNDEVVLNPNK